VADRSEKTKVRLLEAAWDCVREGGTSAATSRAIASKADVNLGAITYHFGSKDRLLAEAYVSAIRRLIEPALQALRRDDIDPISRMLQAVGRLQQSFAGAPDDVPAYLEVLVQSRHMPLLHEGITALFAELRNLLSSEMVAHQAAGIVPEWVDPEPMAALLIAVAQGVVLEAAIDPAGPGQSALVDQFTKLLLAAG